MSEKLIGLKGWLFLVGMIVCLTPPSIIYVMVSVYHLEVFSEWNIFEGTIKYMIIFEYIINVFLLLISIYLVFLFFKKMTKFKLYFILFLGLSAILTVMHSVWALFLFPTLPPLEIIYLDEIAGSIIPALIWIPYMIYSKRVSNTFINE